MKSRHGLHAIIVGTITLLVIIAASSGLGMIYAIGYITPFIIPSIAVMLIGLILHLAKKPRWKAIYIVAWIVYVAFVGFGLTGL